MYLKNLFFIYIINIINRGQKFLAKSKEIKQNWKRSENFDISFCVSFDRYCQKLICEGEKRY